MSRRILVALTFFALAVPLGAQVPPLRVSPYAEIKQRVGLTDIGIVYHRPGVKGRVIWGGLQKYNEVWRAGANEPTLITWSDSVTVSGTRFSPGTYRMVVIPRQDGPWTVVFNSEVKSWGTVYDSTYDVARIGVTPMEVPHEEWMSFAFTDLTAQSASLVLRWEKVGLPLQITVPTAGKYATLARSAYGAAIGTSMAQARYLMDNGSLADAEKAADQAGKIEEGAGTLRLKSEILARQGKYADAIKMAEKAIAVGKSANPRFVTTALDTFIKEWKEKTGGKK